MHARKTGALIRASAAAGAVMAGATDAQLAAIERFASELGLAFQIVDDILDVEGASAELGKTAGKDAAAGKPTYPALYGLDASRRMADGVRRARAGRARRGRPRRPVAGHRALGHFAVELTGRGKSYASRKPEAASRRLVAGSLTSSDQL